MTKRIVFAGSPPFAAAHLRALLDAGTDICAVYSQPDRKTGRGHKLTPTAVKALAAERGIPVYTPSSFKDGADVEAFRELKPDLFIVVAYGLLLPQPILDTCPCINVHGSLLPEYRGAAPIQRALLDGRGETGITIMKMALRLDAGDMLVKKSMPIAKDDTTETLFEKLAALGSRMLVENLGAILEGSITPQRQNEALATYAKKIEKDEGRIDFSRRADEIDRQVRAMIPWPVAAFRLGGENYKVFRVRTEKTDHGHRPGEIVGAGKEGLTVACADGLVHIITLQAPGKGQVGAGQYAKSKSDLFRAGTVLGAEG